MKTVNRHSVTLSLLLSVLLGLSLPAHAVHTALDDYVAAPDSSYGWTLQTTAPMYGFDGAPPQIGNLYTLKMTSQTWQSGKTNPDRSVWTHWITVARPYNAVPGACFMIIDGGSISSTPADISQFAAISAYLGITLAYLQYIPNEPLRFSDGISRTEDSIIAYTYDKFMNLYGTAGEDSTWPLLLPMVKGAVRGMDAVQEFLQRHESMAVSDFIIGGASKRGWTTWLTAAVDPRVKAAVPIVIDILNMQNQLPHHKNAYSNYAPNDTAHHMLGGYSDAIKDYTSFNIFDRLSTPEGTALRQIVDPITYRDRLTMPKLIINSTGDQFFLPDGIKYYFNQIPGENHIFYVPNSDHSLSIDLEHPDMLLNILSFVRAFVPGSGVTLPKFDWAFQPDGSIRVVADQLPEEVSLWQAHVETYRDFRLENVGAIWSKTTISDPDGDGVYVGSVPEPATGWTGFYVSVKVAGLETCSGLRVVPDTYPNAATPPDTWQPVFENCQSAPANVQTGATATITFTASEALAASPEVLVNDHPASLQSVNGLNYVFAYTVLASDPEGPANIKISGTDLAGNPGFSRWPATLVVDNLPTTIASVTAVPALCEYGNEITLSFTASEPLHATPALSVNGHAAAIVSLEGLAYTYTYTVGGEDADGFANIQVSASDFAGNSFAPTFCDVLKVDNTRPHYSAFTVTPARAKPGGTVTVSFTADEALNGTPDVIFIGLGNATLQSLTGNDYVFSYTISDAAAEGPVSIHVDGYDLLWHRGRDPFDGFFAVDNTPPTLSGFSVTPALVNETGAATIAISASESLGAAPAVTVNGHAAALQSTDSNAFTYLYSVAAADPEGLAVIAIDAADIAGNPASLASSDTLLIDKLAPTGALTVNAGAAYTNTPAVTLACSFDDGQGAGVDTMRFSDNGTDWSAWMPAAATAGRTLPGPDGMATVHVQYADRAGHVSPALSDGILLDTAGPTGTIFINNNRSATNATTVNLTLAWEDGPGSGAARMRFSNDGSTWTLWEPLAASKPHVIPSGDGHKTVRVQYLDRAGNRSLALTDYIRLDTTPPIGSITINNNDKTTSSPNVTLTLIWSDIGGSLVSRMRFSDNVPPGPHGCRPPRVVRTRCPPIPAITPFVCSFSMVPTNYSAVYNDYIKLIAP